LNTEAEEKMKHLIRISILFVVAFSTSFAQPDTIRIATRNSDGTLVYDVDPTKIGTAVIKDLGRGLEGFIAFLDTKYLVPYIIGRELKGEVVAYECFEASGAYYLFADGMKSECKCDSDCSCRFLRDKDERIIGCKRENDDATAENKKGFCNHSIHSDQRNFVRTLKAVMGN